MTKNHELALIVSYYLSRCDKEAYTKLGYKSFNHAAREIGKILNVNPNTVKNMRDEFDPYHENNRVGWLRELRGSRLKVLKSFEQTDEDSLSEIVKEILSNNNFTKTEAGEDLIKLFEEKNEINIPKNRGSVSFTARGPTGKAAEQFFIDYFKKTAKPVSGELVDRRDFGCGYDFLIKNNDLEFYVEVKGLSVIDGGVQFTNKEWLTAQHHKEKYFLVLIKNISDKPDAIIIQNPWSVLKASKKVIASVQVNWSVAGKDLK